MIGYTRGRTNTAGALEYTRLNMFTNAKGGRSSVKDFIIIITDGTPNINAEATIPEAIKAQLDGIQVIVVSVGNIKETSLLLRSIASNPAERNLFTVQNYNDINRLVDDLVGATCNGTNLFQYS